MLANVEDATVAERVGHDGGGPAFRLLVRLGHRIGIGDPKDSKVAEFERIGASLRREREEYEAELADVDDLLRKVKVAQKSASVRQLYSTLKNRPQQILEACATFNDWTSINSLRPLLRTYFEDRGAWAYAARSAPPIYLRAATALGAKKELPWIRVRDVAWFAALTNDRELAREHAQEALTEFGGTDRRGAAHCYRVIGLLALHDKSRAAEERGKQALEAFGEAIQLATLDDDRGLVARMRAHKAAAYIACGDGGKARIELEYAIEYARESQNLRLLVPDQA